MIDLRKVMSEFERMRSGEIASNAAYLQELVDEPGVTIELCCGDCGTVLIWHECPECALFEFGAYECGLCDGEGGWYECVECDE